MVGALRSPLVLVFLFLGLWIAAFSIFDRYWNRTRSGQEWRAYGGRLNLAIRRRAISMQWLILIVLGVFTLLAAVQFRRLYHSDESPGDASRLAIALIVVSSYMIASILTRILCQIIWRFTPSIQEATKAAKAGLSFVSFRNAMVLLLTQAAIIIPICLLQIYLGSVMR